MRPLEKHCSRSRVILQQIHDIKNAASLHCVCHEPKPVAFASKSLTPAETRYANIECKMLDVVFGCIKFQHYLFGSKFICESDHKPLEDIHLKDLKISAILHLGYRGYYWKFNPVISPLSTFQVLIYLWQMHSAESAHIRRLRLKGWISPSMSLNQLCPEYRLKESRRQPKRTPHSNSSCSRW